MKYRKPSFKPGVSKRIALAAVLALGAANAVLASSASLVASGSAPPTIRLVFIPSGYSAAEQALFQAEVRGNLDRLWGGPGVAGVPWFVTNRERFDSYEVLDDWSLVLNPGDAAVRSFISNISSPTGLDQRYDQGLGVRNVHIVILNRSGGDAGARGGWVQITNQMDGEYTLAHELGLHVLGTTNWGPAGQPVYDDEYILDSRCSTSRHSKFVLNAHDRDSTDKWSHDVNGEPLDDTGSFLGGWYCRDTFYRPYRDSIGYHPGYGGSAPFGFGALGRMIVDIGLGKRLGERELTPPSIGPADIDGVSAEGLYSGQLEIVATPSDASGIYRVDFYWARAGDPSRSRKMDINEHDEDGAGANDYRLAIDTTQGADGSYFLDVIAWDKNLNYRRVTTRVDIDNTPPAAPADLSIE